MAVAIFRRFVKRQIIYLATGLLNRPRIEHLQQRIGYGQGIY